MKRCIIYGNCHVWPIRKYLLSSPSFNKIYEMNHVPPVHQCNMATGLADEDLRSCDLFIYQRVKDSFGPYLSTDYLLSRLPESCIRISFANAYFAGYYPQVVTDPVFPYGDRNVIRLLKEGRSKEEILSLLSDEDFYGFDEVRSVLDATMNELRSRETDIDIPIAEFVEKHFRGFPLFYTYNHPTYHICRYLAMQMLARLGLPEQEIAEVVRTDDFSDHVHLIYPSVMKHLQLTFIKPDAAFNQGNVPLQIKPYLANYIDYLVTSHRLESV